MFRIRDLTPDVASSIVIVGEEISWIGAILYETNGQGES